jgi:hypothetical protein
MDPKSVDIGRGVAWFSCGWRIFAKSPGLWIVLTVLLLVIVLVLVSIPFGGFVLTLFTPVLAAGLLHGARELKAGRALELAHLFQGFRDQTKLSPLIALGAVALGAGIVSALIVAVFVGGTMMSMDMDDPAYNMMRFGTGGLIALLLIVTVHLAATALIYFAVPLVMFRGMPPGQAMASSVRACIRNVLPLFAFSVIYLVVAIVASIPLGLGWLVLVPWSVGMLYCSYEDIYAPA